MPRILLVLLALPSVCTVFFPAGIASAFAGGTGLFYLQNLDTGPFAFLVDANGSFVQSGTLDVGRYNLSLQATAAADTNGPEIDDAWSMGNAQLTFSSPVLNEPVGSEPVQLVYADGAQGGTPQHVFDQFTGFGDFNSAFFLSEFNEFGAGTVGAASISSSLQPDSLSLHFSTRGYNIVTPNGGELPPGRGGIDLSWRLNVLSPITYSTSGEFEFGGSTREIHLPPPPSGPGSSQGLPLLPIGGSGGAWEFSGCSRCDANGDWIDPPLTSGYDFTMLDDSLFTKIGSLPVGIDGDDAFLVSVGGVVLGTFHGGDGIDFIAVLGHGVSAFQVSGIDPAVDVENPLGFPIQLAYDSNTARFLMTPVPEPTTALLLGFGLGD